MSNTSSAVPPPSGNSGRPSLFWRGLLLASLMVNLLVIGMVFGHFWGPSGMGRPMGPAYSQLAPGKFFAEATPQRRRELNEAMHNSRQEVQRLRSQADENAQKLAAELEQDNYDAAKVNNLIDSFTTGPESIAAGGGKVLKDFYANLTAAERKQVAKAIRETPAHENRPDHGWRGRFWN